MQVIIMIFYNNKKNLSTLDDPFLARSKIWKNMGENMTLFCKLGREPQTVLGNDAGPWTVLGKVAIGCCPVIEWI